MKIIKICQNVVEELENNELEEKTVIAVTP